MSPLRLPRRRRGADFLEMDPSFEFLEKAGKGAVSFGIGQPDFSPPGEVLEALRTVGAEALKYTPPLGLPELREALAGYLSEKYGVDVKPSEVAVTPGATAAVFASLVLLVRGRARVVVQDPGFPMYDDVARFAGGRVVYAYSGIEESFEWSAESIAGRLGEGGVAVLNFPNNPTGSLAPRGLLEELGGLAARKGFYVVSDEVYEDFVYEGSHESVLQVPELRERSVYVGSFSKTWGLAGLRLGYVVAPRRLVERLEAVAVNVYGSPPSPAQLAALRALDHGLGWFSGVLSEYRRRRDALLEELSKVEGVELYRPRGAFYVYPRVRGLLKRLGVGSSRELAESLLQAGVVVLPGDAYSGRAGREHVRLSYALPVESIREGVRRIRAFVEEAACARRKRGA
ncbi:pyridoxal phosphate-dependent aminotransferase [Thermofilum pendens]|uniref:pyridoxal phosphate-dependent aminotransferase n=1 Tax=Thermofilum pendens TaxID=2269 RepID=UPI000699F9CD|nr:aminotransferase class I/II-fold pyridoxal phosphate-dependent enzyme [Thermofilum pendens]